MSEERTLTVTQPVKPRFADMTDAEVQAEAQHFKAELNRLTGGRGDEVALKANSLRFAWLELERRGVTWR